MNTNVKKPDSVFIAENATVVGDVTIADDANIWFGAVIRADKAAITLGTASNIQDNVVLHTSHDHPIIIGDEVSVGHGAILHGCTIEDRTLIGMGAIVLNGAVIGEGCIIGAGALVSEGKKIPSRSLVIGLPGKIVRNVSDEEYAANISNAKGYTELAKKYMDD